MPETSYFSPCIYVKRLHSTVTFHLLTAESSPFLVAIDDAGHSSTTPTRRVPPTT